MSQLEGAKGKKNYRNAEKVWGTFSDTVVAIAECAS